MHQGNCNCPACGRAPDAFEAEAAGGAAPAPTCTQKLKGLSVAVVGGGLAGLMAARTLCRQGMTVKVFEARTQVGGRVLSDYGRFSKGRITELGAELVGSIHTYWCKLAIEYGLALVSRMDADLYRGQQLKLRMTLDKDLSMDEIRALDEDMVNRVLLPIARLASGIREAARPWEEKDPARLKQLKAWDGMSVADALIGLGVKRGSRLWLALHMLLVNDNVKPLEQLNYLGLLCLVRGGQFDTIKKEDALMGYWNELEIYRCADGCQTLALKMAADIQGRKYRCQVALRRAVTQIDLEPLRGKAVSLTSRAVVVRTGGKVVYGPARVEGFDHVVFAIPPSVWREVAFKPAALHPATTIGVMDSGGAVKFFTDLKDRFWLRTGHAPYGGSLALGQVWEGTDNQTRIGDQGIVLSVFAGGRTPMPDEKDFKRELKKLYPNYPDKPKTRFANWPAQPFIKAGFVSPGKNQVFNLGKPLNEPYLGHIFFAGEHTQMDHFGYMEGALRSGERAANQLMRQACRPPQMVASAAVRRAAEVSW
jgi:monoamine oxidase